MKFKVAQEPLLQGVAKVSGVIPTRTPLTFLYNIHAVLSGNELKLTASDGDVFLITRVTVEGAEDGSMLVPARPLQDLLRELPGAELHLETTPEQHLVVNTTRGRFTIPGEDPGKFPPAPEERPPTHLHFSSEELKNILEQTTFAVSHDELRPALTGLLMQFHSGEMRAVATDGHRLVKLVRTGMESLAASGSDVEVIVPLRSLSLLSRHLSGEDVEHVEVFLAPNRVVFDTGSLVITSKVVEGKFPAYDAVIPKDNSLVLHVDQDKFSAAVRRVSIFSNQINRLVVLNLGPDSIKITAEDPDSGRRGQEEIEATFSGEPFDIGYNANYLLEALRHVSSAQVEMRLGSPTAAGILQPAEQKENEDLLMLLMPIRLQ
ncbi:MAG: DNA polymerase III subunit beta [Candidatus Zixiibacteriota bacterium]|nr:MAG: DNA polymerase III subunit beta [candidate division Zixibacteria bacterium]